MAWMESHQSLKNHPKVFDLMHSMGWDLDTTIGKLHRFWWWCVDYAESGDLTKHNNDRLARAVGLNGGKEAKKFVEEMIKASWIDTKPYLRVHNWWDYVGKFLQGKYSHNPDVWRRIQKAYEPYGYHKQTTRKPYIPTNLTNLHNQQSNSDTNFIKLLKANPAYKGVDIDRELAKMDAWFLTPKGSRRRKTKRFIVSWLNRCDAVVQFDPKPQGKDYDRDNKEQEEKIARWKKEQEAEQNSVK